MIDHEIDITALQAQRDALIREVARLQGKIGNETANFVDAQIATGRFAPRWRGLLVSMLNFAEQADVAGGVVMFGEGSQPAPAGFTAAQLKEFMEKLDPPLRFGEYYTRARVRSDLRTEQSPLVKDAERRAAERARQVDANA